MKQTHQSFRFMSFQKPKQKDWHPPDGFILGLWTLILLVFFKTYGIKHLKHIFWSHRGQRTSSVCVFSFIRESTITFFMFALVRNRLFIFLMQVCFLWVLLCIIFWKWHALTWVETFFVVCSSVVKSIWISTRDFFELNAHRQLAGRSILLVCWFVSSFFGTLISSYSFIFSVWKLVSATDFFFFFS